MSLVVIPIVILVVAAAFARWIWIRDLRHIEAEDSFEREMRETCQGPAALPDVARLHEAG